jgi:hypothetical protein
MVGLVVAGLRSDLLGADMSGNDGNDESNPRLATGRMTLLKSPKFKGAVLSIGGAGSQPKTNAQQSGLRMAGLTWPTLICGCC